MVMSGRFLKKQICLNTLVSSAASAPAAVWRRPSDV
jgi:hypothetical protein